MSESTKTKSKGYVAVPLDDFMVTLSVQGRLRLNSE